MRIARRTAAAALSAAALAVASAATARPAEPGPRVFLIGLDGASWRWLDPLAKQGRLPNLAKLMRRGCTAELESDVSYSPVTWTSIATGKNRHKHGIESLDPRDGMPQSTQRKVKALWNILSERKIPVLVSSYFATQPAEPVEGVMVSKEWLDHDRSSDDGLYPPDAFGAAPREEVVRLTASTGFDPAPDVPSYSRQAREAHRVFALQGGLDGDARAVWTAKHFLSRRRFGFLAVHLWGLDVASHFFVKPAPARVLERYYELADARVGELLAHADAGTDVLVLSDHGERAVDDPRVRARGAWLHTGDHEPEGVLIMAGPGTRRCARRARAGVFDVAPTVLYLMGLPAAKDMDGGPLVSMLEPGRLAARPPAWIDTYESTSAVRPPATSPRAKDLELLRRMGYIQ